MESSSEHWFPQGEGAVPGTGFILPGVVTDGLSIPRKKKKFDSPFLHDCKIGINLITGIVVLLFGITKEIVSTFVATNSHGFSLVL